jgi:hypothetical protein
MIVEILKDDKRLGLKKGHWYEAEVYLVDRSKLTLKHRISKTGRIFKGDPMCNVYRSEIKSVNIDSYRIMKPFILSFIVNGEQRNIYFDKDTDGHIDVYGNVAWYSIDGYYVPSMRYRTITSMSVIKRAIDQGIIEKIPTIELRVETVSIPAGPIVGLVDFEFEITPDGCKFT